jgi:hypothetical protein
MLTAGLFTVIAVLWLSACALVVWLIWRAARRDSGTREAAPAETAGRRPRRDDQAA